MPPTPNVANPWGVTRWQARALDAYLVGGTIEAASQSTGIAYKPMSELIMRGLRQIPGNHRLHKIMHWRDLRGALPTEIEPHQAAKHAAPFGVTDKQAEALDIWYQHGKLSIVAIALGLSSDASAWSRITLGERKIPGDTHEHKRNAWMLARGLQPSQL